MTPDGSFNGFTLNASSSNGTKTTSSYDPDLEEHPATENHTQYPSASMQSYDPDFIEAVTTDIRIEKIEHDLTHIKEELAAIKATLVNADATISKVAAEVMPTINQLMESPMLKMLGVRKDKKS